MSKIVCDVCGTSYPETATQCPICGCVRPADVSAIINDSVETDRKPNGEYTYVKGGRFSKANVKKRNQGLEVPKVESAKKSSKTEKSEKKNSDTGFIVAVVLLLAAIVAVVIYIALQFFGPITDSIDDNTVDTTPSTTEQTLNTLSDTLEIPCDEVLLSKTVVEFDRVGAAIFMNVKLYPSDTTDERQFYSSDESVATVDVNGRVTAVGAGEAIITVSCGSAEATCQIICNFETENTEPDATKETDPTETTSEQTSENVDFALNRTDFTMFGKGETYKLYTGNIPADQINWYSDDETVATISNGVVTAVGGGYTTVYGEYQGVKRSCIVRCGFTAAENVPEEDTTENGDASSRTYTISHSDVTISVDEVFSLILSDESGNAVDVTWNVSDSSICSVSGNTVTGLNSGQTTISVTYNGKTYSCIIRVK